jgi:hypothetical protein
MKLCSKCGYANDDLAKECKNCYHKFELEGNKRKKSIKTIKPKKPEKPKKVKQQSTYLKYIKTDDNIKPEYYNYEETPAIFNPVHRFWPNILLFVYVLIELIGLIYGIRLAIIQKSWMILGITFSTILIVHTLVMISLNMLFNIQKIQENTTKIIELLSKNNK